MAEPPPEMRKKTSVSFFAFFSMARAARAAANDSSFGKRVAAFKVAESPVALFRQVLGAADSAQAFAALHAVEQDFEHRAGGLAQRDDKNALELREIDGVGSAAVGNQALQRVALEANAPIEGGLDAACLERAGKELRGTGMEKIESGITGRRHCTLLLQPACERLLHRLELACKKVIGAGDEHQVFGIGGGIDHLSQILLRGERVAISTEEELGQGALREHGISIGLPESLGWKPQGDQGAKISRALCLRVCRTGRSDRHRRSKAEADAGRSGKLVFGMEPVERGGYIAGLCAPIMLPSLSPVPRKLKRNTGQRRPHSGAFSTFMA